MAKGLSIRIFSGWIHHSPHQVLCDPRNESSSPGFMRGIMTHRLSRSEKITQFSIPWPRAGVTPCNFAIVDNGGNVDGGPHRRRGGGGGGASTDPRGRVGGRKGRGGGARGCVGFMPPADTQRHVLVQLQRVAYPLHDTMICQDQLSCRRRSPALEGQVSQAPR